MFGQFVFCASQALDGISSLVVSVKNNIGLIKSLTM